MQGTDASNSRAPISNAGKSHKRGDSTVLLPSFGDLTSAGTASFGVRLLDGVLGGTFSDAYQGLTTVNLTQANSEALISAVQGFDKLEVRACVCVCVRA